jgi:hypothetical protein
MTTTRPVLGWYGEGQIDVAFCSCQNPRPPVTQHKAHWIEMLPHLLQLIATQQIDITLIVAQIEADVAFPAAGVISVQDGDAARLGCIQCLAPIQPRAGQCGVGAGDSGLGQAPVDERRTPRRLVVVAANIGVGVVFGDAGIAASDGVLRDAHLSLGDRHPWSYIFSSTIVSIYEGYSQFIHTPISKNRFVACRAVPNPQLPKIHVNFTPAKLRSHQFEI